MKFTLNNFYSNNYKDFIHLEALKNILRKVPELNLAGLENIENVLSMEFSVDDWGENPMYITYIDTDNKEHIVKIRPAVTEQIYEILKAYAKISYVDEQDKKLKDELHTEIMQGDENTLNLSKTYTDTVVNHARDEINHTIETGNAETLEASKNYTDTQLGEYETKADAKAEHDKLSTEVENANKVYGYDAIANTWEKCNGSFTVSYNNSNITKLGYCQTNGEVEKGVDFTKLATNEKVETINQLVTANDNKTTQALANVNDRIDNLPRSSEATLGGTTFKERLNIETDTPNDFYSTVTLEQRDGSEPEVVGRLVKGDVAKKDDLDLLSGKVTEVDELKTNVTNLLNWKTTVTDEITRMNGGVTNIPKEEFTPLNGLTTDPNTVHGQIFRFNNFAIIRLNVYVGNITMASWTFKEAVSFPKSYLNGFSKFTALNTKRQSADGNLAYDTSFDIDKCLLGFYVRGNDFNNAGVELSIAGMLYN